MKHWKNLLSVLVVVMLVALGIKQLEYWVRPTDTDGAYYQIESLHSLPENTVEVIVYGSSHAFRGLNTMELYDRFGIGAYNYAWHWQKLNTIKLFLDDSLKVQKPKVVLIEAYTVGMVLENTDVTPEVYYCNYIPNSQAKRDYMKQCLGKDANLDTKLSYIMPFALFHNNWNGVNEASFKQLGKDGIDALQSTMGYSYCDDVKEVTICGFDEATQQSLPSNSLRELDEIVSLCKENNAEVVFFVVPWNGAYAYSDAMIEYAKEHDCVFLDLIKNYEDVGLDGKTDFSDEGHLNINGATKVSDYLGSYLTENYDLQDMRKVEDNLWEKAKGM